MSTTFQPGALFRKLENQLFEIVGVTEDKVLYCVQGGGFLCQASEAEFSAQFVPAQLGVVLEPITVAVEGSPAFAAFSDGRRWNGWIIPLVSKEIAQDVIAFCEKGAPSWITFAWKDNVLSVTEHDGAHEHSYEIEPTLYQTATGEQLLYNLSLGWCWELVPTSKKQCLVPEMSHSENSGEWYLGKLREVNGEAVYNHLCLIFTAGDPDAVLERVAATYYGTGQKDGDVYWHRGGTVTVEAMSCTALEPETAGKLKNHLSIHSDIERL